MGDAHAGAGSRPGGPRPRARRDDPRLARGHARRDQGRRGRGSLSRDDARGSARDPHRARRGEARGRNRSRPRGARASRGLARGPVRRGSAQALPEPSHRGAHTRHERSRPRVHPDDLGRRGRPERCRAHARRCLRRPPPGRALAGRVPRGRRLVHRRLGLGRRSLERTPRALVTRRGGRSPRRRVRSRRAARPPRPARRDHPLPDPR